LFVATDKEIEEAIGKYTYFGEVLGKHSEVYCNLTEDHIKKLDLDSETVAKVSVLLGSTWSGFNPLYYIKYMCNECEDNFRSDEMFDITEDNEICEYCQRKKEATAK